MSRFAAPIAEQIWDMKYRFKSAEGTPRDVTVEDTWRRIARDLARVEQSPEAWEERFYAALEDFKYLPAGRITAGAGTARRVTLFNCFVMGTIPDSMGGIFDMLKEAALTMQQGGGIGYDFSTIRPKGADVKGVSADASGPLSFMDVWDAMCRTIMSAGSRRGAMMATMRCDHPDIEDFIAAKGDPARLRMFNMSVLVTDPFMEAVKADGPWDLTFDGRVYRTVEARDLWNRIMRATYDYAEPGVIFIDRINQANNLGYCEQISATNPCVTEETWVSTTEGARQVRDLVDRPFTALVDGAAHASGPQGFFATGTKPVLRLTTSCGRALRLTEDHLVRRVTEKTRWRLESAWVKAGDLTPGDEVMLHDHRAAPLSESPEEARGYLLGLLVGDGTVKEDKTLLSVWAGRPCADGTATAPGAIMRHVEGLLRAMPHRADFAGWTELPERGEFRTTTAALRRLAEAHGITRGRKTITPQIEAASAGFTAAFLRGLFDADGSVQGSQEKGLSVRLSQSDLPLLEAAQRMLSRLGINSTLHANRRPAGARDLPDGKGGTARYATRAQHELILSGANLQTFRDRVGFIDSAKRQLLESRLAAYDRTLNRERFTARVESLVPDGDAPVFDVQIPGINAFDANGLYVHNCGEQPLPPYGACLLGSINLARLVADPFAPEARLDEAALGELVTTAVRMMDNVVDVSQFPLEAQAQEAQAKRRIGLGVTGLADALLMIGVRYGSDAAAAQTEAWMKLIARAAYLASVELAKEKGPFPLFDAEAYLASGTMQQMDADVRAAIREHGIRNALLTSIAPTGTISLYAGNVSSGIEPVFAYAYTRKVLQKDGSRTEEEVVDYAVQLWREKFGEEELPEYFVNAQTLAPLDHVKMQAAAQKWVDSSISKTINCPEDISFEAFKDVYMAAWDSGCKGCTTYRPNEVTGSVLSVSEEKPKAAALPELANSSERLKWAMGNKGWTKNSELADAAGVDRSSIGRYLKDAGDELFRVPSKRDAELLAAALEVTPGWLLFGETPGAAGQAPTAPMGGASDPARGPGQPSGTAAPEVVEDANAGDIIYMAEPLDRPSELEGNTYKVKWPDSEHALYITINDIVLNGHRRPFEVFINSKNMEHFAWTVALTRMISAVFRRGGDVSFVVEELKAVFDPRGGAWMGGKYIPSILAAIGGVIERHMIATGFIAGEGMGLKTDPQAKVVGLDAPRGKACPSCGQYEMRMIEGCMTCASCGHSKCG